MTYPLMLALLVALSLAGCKGGDKAAGGPPCDRLAAALCEKDQGPCKEFIAKRTERMDKAKADAWCESIVKDPAAVKVHKEDAQKGAAGAR